MTNIKEFILVQLHIDNTKPFKVDDDLYTTFIIKTSHAIEEFINNYLILQLPWIIRAAVRENDFKLEHNKPTTANINFDIMSPNEARLCFIKLDQCIDNKEIVILLTPDYEYEVSLSTIKPNILQEVHYETPLIQNWVSSNVELIGKLINFNE